MELRRAFDAARFPAFDEQEIKQSPQLPTRKRWS